MTIDEITKLLDSLTKLCSALAWPLIVALNLHRFGPALKEFIYSMGEFSFKGAGFEASAKHRKDEASAALVAASAKLPKQDNPDQVVDDAKEAISLVQNEVTSKLLRRVSGTIILWVDDQPRNTLLERQSLEALGISFVIATDTEEAISIAKKGKFNAIISDMGRPPDNRAGYTLLTKLQELGDSTPFIIYSGSNSPEHRAEARKLGAYASTNRPQELFEFVLQALRSTS